MKYQLQLQWIKMAACCLVTCCGLSATAQNSYDLEWAHRIGAERFDECNATAVDESGNVYITGHFMSTMDFDPGPGTSFLNATGYTYDAFLAKYDPNGNYLWAINLGGKLIDDAAGIALDHQGNVYVTGTFSDTANFDPDSVAAPLIAAPHPTNAFATNQDIFVAKYDTSGNYQWAIAMGGMIGGSSGNSNTSMYEEYGSALAVDTLGNVYVTGCFISDSADFDPGPNTAILTRQGQEEHADVFVAKYNEDGAYQWAFALGSSAFAGEHGLGIAVAPLGDQVYVAGHFRDTTDFDPGAGVALLSPEPSVLPPYSGYRGAGFVAKYDGNGQYQWALKAGTHARGITLDASGDVLVTGLFTGTKDFDPDAGTAELTAAEVPGSGTQTFDAFIAKYGGNGDYQWASGMGGKGVDDLGYAVAVDKVGNVYMTGGFKDTVDFDPGPNTVPLVGKGADGNAVAKYKGTDGSYMWAGMIEAYSPDRYIELNNTAGIALDGSGNIYLTGKFWDSSDFDPGPDTFMLTVDDSIRSKYFDGFFLKLTCNDTSSSNLDASIGCGESYVLNGESYDTAGVYTQMLSNTVGCDSIVVLNLTVLPLEPPVINIDGFLLGTTHSYATYQWIKNGLDIPGATDSVYMVTENADYQVRVTNENGCEAISDVYTVTNAGTDIDDVNGISQYVRIYPNPACDVLHIKSPAPVNVQLSSIEGRHILYMKDAQAVPVKGLAKGLYLLHIMDKADRIVKTEKVVIE